MGEEYGMPQGVFSCQLHTQNTFAPCCLSYAGKGAGKIREGAVERGGSGHQKVLGEFGWNGGNNPLPQIFQAAS